MMAEDQPESGKSQSGPKTGSRGGRPFYTRNRKDRPCDGCRRRKTKCTRIPSTSSSYRTCLMCTSHDENCTYNLKPPSRSNQNAKKVRTQTGEQADTSTEPAPLTTKAQSNSASPDDGTHGSAWPRTGSVTDTSPESNDYNKTPISAPPNENEMRSELDFLSMNDLYFSELISPTLLDRHFTFTKQLPGGMNEPFWLSETRILRPVSQDALFLMTKDPFTAEDARLNMDVERIVSPYGEKMVSLYFRFVHPSYPIIHRSSFLSKYKPSPKTVSPPLLAAIYILASNWWTYDSELAPMKPPNVVALSEIANQAIRSLLKRPRLSTIQAGLLLLQRRPTTPGPLSGTTFTDVWNFTSELVAAAQTLGLHLDCSPWSIPSWEIPPRRRTAWALYIQDRWCSACHGMPTRINDPDWFVNMLDIDDFTPEPDHEDELDGGAELMIQLTQLTVILSDITELFVSSSSRRLQSNAATQDIFGLSHPLKEQLSLWRENLPRSLSEITNSTNQQLNRVGYLMLCYYTTEIILHKAVLRALSTSEDQRLIDSYRQDCRESVTQAVNFIKHLSVVHLEAFWIYNSCDCFVEIGSLIALLEMTSSSKSEGQYFQHIRESLRWFLRMSSRISWVFEFALLQLEGLLWKVTDAVVRERHEGSIDESINCTNGLSSSTSQLDVPMNAAYTPSAENFLNSSDFSQFGINLTEQQLQAVFSSQGAHLGLTGEKL